jgi:hypothetical protein
MSAARTSRSTAPDSIRGRTRSAALLIAGCASLALGVPAAVQSAAASTMVEVHFACSKPDSAKIPCYFQTPSHNIRCVWTPKSQDVTCERVSTGRGFVLHPTGKAKAIKVNLTHPGEMLPMTQQIVFPQKLSCLDTKDSIRCNQDEGKGFFSIGPSGSKSA